MARSPAILQADTNQAPYVAQATLAVLALTCAVGAAVGIGSRGDGPGQRTDAELARMEADMLNSRTSRSPDLSALPGPSSLPSSPYPSMPAPALLPQQPAAPQFPDMRIPSGNPGLSPAPAPGPVPGGRAPAKPSLPLGKQLKNPQAMEAVLAARALRDQQDMLTAIEVLKTADLQEPNHPEILGEMALTYEAMQLVPKAEGYWRQIYAMGPQGAGDYYTIAATKIGTRIAPVEAAGASPVSLGQCALGRQPLAQGERIVLRVPILATPGKTIDPSKMEIRVSFYESVNNGAIEVVPQGKTTPNWSSLPTNWADPSAGETADVIYDFFPQRPGSTDTRAFYGYAVKLFYQDKLVGEQAQPEALRNGAQQGGKPAGLDNALFPK
jgi:hypothetical protein